MLKRFAAVAICLLALWAISLERSYAWLGLQSAHVERWLSAGMHPLSFDFTANMPGDVRWQLIAQDGFRATVKAEPDGLHVQPMQGSFELRLNLAGARLIPAQVNALLLELQADTVLPKFSLAVHAGLDDAGWIAELGNAQSTLGQRFQQQPINLETLEFKREPARLTSLHWTQLPPLTHLRLYGDTPTRAPFKLASFAFKSAQEVSHTELIGLRPEALLQAFDAARLGVSIAGLSVAGGSISVATTAYRGPWLAPIVQMWVSVICLSFVCVLLGFEFASETPKHRARARGLLVPAFFLPIIMMLWGNLDWPVDLSAAALSPAWFMLVLGLVIAIAYRWIIKPPSFTRLTFDAPSKAAWLSCAIPTGAAALVLILGFGALVPVELDQKHFEPLLAVKYLAFAAFQQWLLQTLVWANLRRAALTRWNALKLSAVLFALLHTPNFMLMLLCFAGALFWCGHYAKHRRLLPLILSHAFLGTLCVYIIPTSVLRSADIGFSYFLK